MVNIGRKTKLTPALENKIVELIKAGNYAVTSCQVMGISEKTFYEWINKGEDGIEPFSKFSKSIKKARAEATARNVTLIQIAAKKNWQAAAWWLERTQYKRYGKTENTEEEMVSSYNKKVSLTIEQSVEKYEEAAEAALKRIEATRQVCLESTEKE